MALIVLFVPSTLSSGASIMVQDEFGGYSEARETEERERRLHSPFALHAPIQWAIWGDVIKSRG